MRKQLNSLISCQSELDHLVFGIGALVDYIIWMHLILNSV